MAVGLDFLILQDTNYISTMSVNINSVARGSLFFLFLELAPIILFVCLSSMYIVFISSIISLHIITYKSNIFLKKIYKTTYLFYEKTDITIIVLKVAFNTITLTL